MDPLTIGAASVALKGLSSIVHDVGQSWSNKKVFSNLLKDEISKSATTASSSKQAESLSQNLMNKLDKDGDGELSAKESGLKTATFNTIDTDKNGRLSLSEVRQYIDNQSKAK